MAQERPKYDPRLSFGNIVTIAVLVAGGLSTFWFVQFQSNMNADLIKDLKSELALVETSLHRKVDENEDEINDLKLNDARLFEKLDNIYASVRKIEAFVDQSSGN